MTARIAEALSLRTRDRKWRSTCSNRLIGILCSPSASPATTRASRENDVAPSNAATEQPARISDAGINRRHVWRRDYLAYEHQGYEKTVSASA